VPVTGNLYAFLGFVVHGWSRGVEFTNYGRPHWDIDDYRLFNYISDFAETWLKGLYMCQDDTCEIISQSNHSFNSYDQKSNRSIHFYYWMRLIRFCMKILAAADTESDYAIRCAWVSLHLYRWEQCLYNASPERVQYISTLKQ